MSKIRSIDIRKVNKKIKDTIGKEAFEDKVKTLCDSGILKIVDYEEDGTPIVRCTELGLEMAMQAFGNKDKSNAN